jgi:hypothetical protein
VDLTTAEAIALTGHFGADLTEGHSADDEYDWICAGCFADFEDECG